MTKQKSTKRALLLSALSLLMCVSMLIGSTFAWFTDSVTSGNNKIQAGTLKLDLELLEDDGTWTSIKDSGKAIFDYDKWEPGYTDVKVLRVTNEGNLALKWVAKFVSENALSDLADVIDVYVNTEVSAYPADRSDLDGWTKVGTVADFVNSISETTHGNLEAGSSANLGIALKMQETAGNQYQGMDLGGAFDIMILATQYTSESDSFDNQYDKDAIYADHYVATESDLLEAFSAGGSIALMDDVVLTSAVTVSDAIDLNLNGYTLSTVGLQLQNGGTIVNGVIESAGTTKMVAHMSVTGGVLNMDSVTVDVNHHLNANVSWSEATGIDIRNATAVLNDCTVKVNNLTSAKWVYSYGVSLTNAEVTMNGGSIIADCIEGTASAGPTNPNAVCSIGNCTATLNNVAVSEEAYYASTVQGCLTINTTDTTVTSADVVDNRGGSHVINYIAD